VTFKWKYYRAEADARYKLMTLDADEFIRRFLIHVLPDGFHRIRYYGLLANANRAANIALARRLLRAPDPAPSSSESNGADGGHEDEDGNTCPCCGRRMVIIETFEYGRQPRHWPHAISPPRQLVTNTLLTPSPTTAPRRRRRLTGDANARSTTMVNAAVHHQRADHSVRPHRLGCTRGAKNHGRSTRSAAGPVPWWKTTSSTGAKSP
jgi:Putative transposase